MDKVNSSSSHDVIVIRRLDGKLKCTPFQTAFASSVLKARADKSKKINEVQLYVNDRLVDIPMRVDPANGRVNFQKIYYRSRTGSISDSSDISDDDRSQRSTSRQKRLSNPVQQKTDRLNDLKNEQVPKTFWQFAWLFNRKKEDEEPSDKAQAKPVSEPQPDEFDNSLAQIKEEVYEGEDTSKEPLFHLSLCSSLLKSKEKQTKEQILKTFYEHRVQYKDFIKDPSAFINDNNLVVKIDDSIYTWQLGIAILTCRFAYGEELSSALIDNMIKKQFTKSRWLTYFSGSNVSKLDITDNVSTKLALTADLNSSESNAVVKYRKVPDSDMLAKMNLVQGQNCARFVADTGGVPEEITLRIFLWEQDDKIVISDIDGTITKSDILGQIFSNYIHQGVAKLYSEIYKRGYKLLYLTARAIGQYKQTRKFIETVEEDGFQLPPGPILMSPDGYMKSFTREVINKTPDVLKTKILTGLNEIFPSSTRAIFAGFGNRETDNIAYLRINIPEDMIFCISEKSLITNELKKDFSMTYISMLDKIELFFPEYSKKESRLGKGTSEDLEPDRSNEEVEVGRNSDKITTESTDYKERFAVNEPGEQIDNNNIELEPEKQTLVSQIKEKLDGGLKTVPSKREEGDSDEKAIESNDCQHQGESDQQDDSNFQMHNKLNNSDSLSDNKQAYRNQMHSSSKQEGRAHLRNYTYSRSEQANDDGEKNIDDLEEYIKQFKEIDRIASNPNAKSVGKDGLQSKSKHQ